MITKLFSRVFNAVQNEEDELLKQVQNDLDKASKEGKVETEQLSYESSPKEGVINVVDKSNNEVTKFKPTESGFEMKTDDNSFLIPKLTEAIEQLNDKVDKLAGDKNLNKGIEAPSSADKTNDKEGKSDRKDPDGEKGENKEPKEKSESAAHPDQKVVIPIDGQFVTGYIIEEQDGGKVKVKVPSLDMFVTILKSSIPSVQSISASEEPKEPKRTADQYLTFSKRRFVAKPGIRNFSTGKYAIFVDLGNAKMEPFANEDRPLDKEQSNIKCLAEGFNSLKEANDYINDNQEKLREQIANINKRNFVAKS